MVVLCFLMNEHRVFLFTGAGLDGGIQYVRTVC
jgi:hypothetical protein